MKPATIRAAYELLLDNPDTDRRVSEITDTETVARMCEIGEMSLVAKWTFPLSGATGAIIVTVDGWHSWKITGRLINCASGMMAASDLATIADWAHALSALMVRLEATILHHEIGDDLRVGMVVERDQLWRPKGVGIEYTAPNITTTGHPNDPTATSRWRLYAGTDPKKAPDGEHIPPRPVAAYCTSDGHWQPVGFATIPTAHLAAKAEMISESGVPFIPFKSSKTKKR